jgi:hypothetical protein
MVLSELLGYTFTPNQLVWSGRFANFFGQNGSKALSFGTVTLLK